MAEQSDRGGVVLDRALPDLGNDGYPGTVLVSQTVSVTLTVMLVLLCVSAMAAWVVRVRVTVDVVGTVQPVRRWSVRARGSGIVREVLVRAGDTVRTGQALARLDTSEIEGSLQELNARRAAAVLDRRRVGESVLFDKRTATLRADQDWARVQQARAGLLATMVDNQVGTNVDSLYSHYVFGSHIALDRAVGELRSAEATLALDSVEMKKLDLQELEEARAAATIRQLDAQISVTRRRLGYTLVTAPATGIVTTEDLDDLRTAYVQTGQGLFDIVSLHAWQAVAYVSEEAVQKIHQGDSVSVVLRSSEDSEAHRLTGKVTHVGWTPSGGSERETVSRGYRVVASVESERPEHGDEYRLRPGLTVRMRVISRSERIAVRLWHHIRGAWQSR